MCDCLIIEYPVRNTTCLYITVNAPAAAAAAASSSSRARNKGVEWMRPCLEVGQVFATKSDLFSVLSSRIYISCSVCIRMLGCDEARFAEIPCRIIVKCGSFKCCRLSFIRKSLKLAIALLCTLALLSCIILHLMSTSDMNFEAGACFIMAWFFVIQWSSWSIDRSR